MEQGFLPWLMDQVGDQLERNEQGRMVLDGMLREVVAKRIDLYSKLEQAAAPLSLGSRAASVAPEKSAEELPAPATTTGVRRL